MLRFNLSAKKLMLIKTAVTYTSFAYFMTAEQQALYLVPSIYKNEVLKCIGGE